MKKDQIELLRNKIQLKLTSQQMGLDTIRFDIFK